MDDPAFRIDHMYAASCGSMAGSGAPSLQFQTTVSSVTQQQSPPGCSKSKETTNHKQENGNVKKDPKSVKSSTNDGLGCPLGKRSTSLCHEQKGKGQTDGKHVAEMQNEICHRQSSNSTQLIPEVADKCGRNMSSEKDFSLQSLDHQYHAADKRPFQSVSDDQRSPSTKCLHSPVVDEVLNEDRTETSIEQTEGDFDKHTNSGACHVEHGVVCSDYSGTKDTGDGKLNQTELDRKFGMSIQQKKEVDTVQKLSVSTLLESQVDALAEEDGENSCHKIDETQQLKEASTNPKAYTTAADLLELETNATELQEMGTGCGNRMEVADNFENEGANKPTEMQSVQKNNPVEKKQTIKMSAKTVKAKAFPKASNINNSKEPEKTVSSVCDSIGAAELEGVENSDDNMDSAESALTRHSVYPQKVPASTGQEDSLGLTDPVEILEHSEIRGSRNYQSAKDLTKSSECEDCTECERCDDLREAELSRCCSDPNEIKESAEVEKAAEPANKIGKEARDISSMVENEHLGVTQEGDDSGKDSEAGQRSSLQQQSWRKNKKRSHEDAGLSMLKPDACEMSSKTSLADNMPPKKTRSKKRAGLQILENTSQYLIPLKEHGWLREVVFRNVFSDLTPSGQKPADIYYRTPEGTKLRSMVQVAQYLRDHPQGILREDNFTFLRKPLFEEPWELVRNAGSLGRGQSGPRTSNKDKTVSHTTPKYDRSQKQQDSDPWFSPSSDAGDSEDEELNNDRDWSIISGPSDIKKAKGLIRTRGRGRGWLRGNWEVREEPREMEILVQNMPPPEIIIDRADDGEGLALGEDFLDGSQFVVDRPDKERCMAKEANAVDSNQVHQNGDKTTGETSLPFEPVHFGESSSRLQSSNVCASKATARKSTTPRIKRKLPSSKSHSTKEVEISRGQLCSNICPGRNGQPPELQCCICMCLFHHECVNVEKSSQAEADHFRCLRCVTVPTPPPSVSATCTSGRISTSRQDLVQETASAPAPLSADLRVPAPQLTDLRVPAPQLTDLRVPAPQLTDSSVPVPQLTDFNVPVPQLTDFSVPAPQLTVMHQPSFASHVVMPIGSGQRTPQHLTPHGAAVTQSESLMLSVGPNSSDALVVMHAMVEKQGQVVGTSLPPLVTPSPPPLFIRGPAPPLLTPSNRANPPQSLLSAFRPPPRLMAAPGIPTSMATPAVAGVGGFFQPSALYGNIAAALTRGTPALSAPSKKNSKSLISRGASVNTLPPTVSAELCSMPLPPPPLSVSALAVASALEKTSMPLPDLAAPGNTSAVPLPAGQNFLPLPHPTPSSSSLPMSLHSGKSPSCQPNPAQVLTLPASIVKRVNLNKTLALKINNRHILVPPYCVLKSKDAVKVVLPPGTFTIPPNSHTVLSLTVSNNTLSATTPLSIETISPAITDGQDKQLEGQSNNVVSSSDDNSRSTDKSTGDGPLVKHQLRAKAKSQINPSQCMMHRLFGGFDAMLQIFRFLHVPDLLIASQVCSSWLQIARQRSLWQTVNLKNLLVTDWEKALTFMRNCGTQKLLLKGLKHKSNQSQGWQSFVENLGSLAGIEHIEFGLVPAVVVHAAVEKLPQLEVFKAEHITLFTDIYREQMWTTLTKLDVGKFGTLSRLQELRLRGVLGLVLPTFTFNGNLAELTHLKHLHSLSLTSLHAVRDIDFNFLARMKHLRVLELGNCVNWTSETYARLGELRELQHLRLECGGEIPDVGLGDALLNLTKLERLELILFVLPASLNKALSELACLHTLILWPDTGCGILPATVNSNAVAAVLNVKHLQVLEWGLMVNEPGSNTDTHSQTRIHPVQDSSTISVLCNGCSLDPDFQHSNDDILNLPVKEFTERLCSALPLCTTVRVLSTHVVGRRLGTGAL